MRSNHCETYVPAIRPFSMWVGLVALLLLTALACGSEESNTPEPGEPEAGEPEAMEPDPGEPEAGEPEAMEPEPGEPEVMEPDPEPDEFGPVSDKFPNGNYLVGMSVSVLNGLILPFQLSIATEDMGDTATMRRIELRAVGDDNSLSDLLVTVSDVAIDANGDFEASTGVFTIPGEFLPTGSDADVEVTFLGSVTDNRFFCGDITGEIVSFGFDLAGSTFGARPFDEQEEGPTGSCSGDTGTTFVRLDAEECPTLVAGRNRGFSSNEADREFEVIVPENYTEDAAWPIIFVFHGLGGNIEGLVQDSVLETLATERGAIVVVPLGDQFGTDTGWDVLAEDTIDIAFFDDMLTCTSASWNVDPERVHVTGISNGGLMVGAITTVRADVLASIAPISGGLTLNFEGDDNALPALVTWGGEVDMAFEVNFHQLNTDMIAAFQENNQFVATCNHGEGHVLEPTFWPWIFEFLLAHPRGVSPEPYSGGLPDSFPEFCSIP